MSVIQYASASGPLSGAPLALFAGNGAAGSGGNGGLSTSAQLNGPTHVAVGPDGAVYIADMYNNEVRRVTPAAPGTPGIINAFAEECSPRRFSIWSLAALARQDAP
jgi:DNA-binding beta-propeller fold protein YncE